MCLYGTINNLLLSISGITNGHLGNLVSIGFILVILLYILLWGKFENILGNQNIILKTAFNLIEF